MEKQEFIHKIEVIGNYKNINVLKKINIVDNGKIIASSNQRYALNCTDDISSEPTEVQSVVNAVWTDEIKAAYAAHLAVQQQELNNG
jgi:hypothetical protein